MISFDTHSLANLLLLSILNNKSGFFFRKHNFRKKTTNFRFRRSVPDVKKLKIQTKTSKYSNTARLSSSLAKAPIEKISDRSQNSLGDKTEALSYHTGKSEPFKADLLQK